MAVDLTELNDIVETGIKEISQYRFECILNAERLLADEYDLDDLNWESVPYGESDVDLVPDDRRGIYAFTLKAPHPVLPPHGYVMYIGIAGRRSNRSLRSRYRDYLNTRKVAKRLTIARLIGTWHNILQFQFAPVDADMSSEDLEQLEKQLNSCMMPVFSDGDLEAETKAKRKAFR
ncbi:hypothetical protein [Erythrobacter crassostreae]|uniref:GIY-YIG domain-containing protein n=1 Tax=Erythrobacter crassostreae TaxID=2828328 RepID=A0A9X1F3H2_9SPHN|nr:hypothetical protein [Erythrobacter crassostrea]MBV7259367.1 hypothetical protein [Erythrobacter crassostrea]